MSELIFRIRGYTPLPFLVVALIWANPRYDLMIFGAILMIFGELMRYISVSYIGPETRQKEIALDKLVTNGPYAYLRNPIYFGNVFIYMGASILSGALLPYLLYIVIIFFSIQYHFCVRYEESKLQERFEDDYLHYASAVPRFFPRMSGYPEKGARKPELMAAIRWERGTLLSIAFFIAFNVLIYYLNV